MKISRKKLELGAITVVGVFGCAAMAAVAKTPVTGEGFGSVYLAELAGIATIGAFLAALWTIFVLPRQRKREKEREDLEKERDATHQKEIGELREHFQLDITVQSLADTQKQQGKDIQILTGKVSDLRKEVLEQTGEMSEMHTVLNKVDNRMEEHLEQTAVSNKENEGRFTKLETKMDNMGEKVDRMEVKVDRINKN